MKRRTWTAYLFVLPALLLFAVFVVYPLVYNVILSVHTWNGVAPNWKPVALGNYVQLVHDRVVGISLRNSGIFVLGHLCTLALALLLAVFLNRAFFGREWVRTLVFLPGVLASTVIAVTWASILEPNLGPLNQGLRAIGLGALAQQWLGNPRLAIWSLVAVGIWAGVGFPMVVYLASLQSIEPELYDAAQIDGANGQQILRFITFPLLRSTHITLLMLGIIASVQAFDAPFILTHGGPYYATMTLTIHVYKNVFSFSQFGYGAALSQFTLVLLVLLILLQRAVFRRGEIR